MNTRYRYPAALGVVAVGATMLFGFSGHANSGQQRRLMNDPAKVERGRYIAHRVGMCIDCHSPRDEQGRFIEDRHLTGSPLAFAPAFPVPVPWAKAAPRIAGMPADFTQEDTVHFLMTGERPNGRPPPLDPMPPYRLNRGDAEAVVAYLQSLSPRE